MLATLRWWMVGVLTARDTPKTGVRVSATTMGLGYPATIDTAVIFAPPVLWVVHKKGRVPNPADVLVLQFPVPRAPYLGCSEHHVSDALLAPTGSPVRVPGPLGGSRVKYLIKRRHWSRRANITMSAAVGST